AVGERGIFFRFGSRVSDHPIERIDAHSEFTGGIFAPPLVGGLRELRKLVDQLVAVGIIEVHGATSWLPTRCRASQSCRSSSAWSGVTSPPLRARPTASTSLCHNRARSEAQRSSASR